MPANYVFAAPYERAVRRERVYTRSSRTFQRRLSERERGELSRYMDTILCCSDSAKTLRESAAFLICGAARTVLLCAPDRANVERSEYTPVRRLRLHR